MTNLFIFIFFSEEIHSQYPLLSLLSHTLVPHKVATSKGHFCSDLLLLKEGLSLAGMCMGHGCIKCIKNEVQSPEG